MGFDALKRLFHSGAQPAPLGREDSPPQVAAWAEQVGEQLQKMMRAQMRLALKVDDLEKKIEGGFDDLRQAHQLRQDDANGCPDEILDILDGLDEASRTLSVDAPEAAQGLERLIRRLEATLLQNRFLRLKGLQQPPDGRLFRVVGTTSASAVAEGLVAQVIRAAVITPSGALVREGEVLTSRGDA